MLTTCVATGTCDAITAKSFFCRDAVILSGVISSINQGMPPVAQMRMQGLDEFLSDGCAHERMKHDEVMQEATVLPWDELKSIIKDRELEGRK